MLGEAPSAVFLQEGAQYELQISPIKILETHVEVCNDDIQTLSAC